ncbi:putative protein OS=Bosea thiooxidans OX=53254 GN=SAMN05660750_04073 PE=4 SV=1 [Bosea thiooxidans]|uniref:Uncharacterized protein n=1 Tax=Bosea thiooxidans TaxID=53254 RepID=A0A1T5GI49_9HYPH|nr:hypothetical protein [Bosea thiooxidans]SKC08069.1 hypothetical protein SAMN05660750_04073 [Bosea thiooxidans]
MKNVEAIAVPPMQIRIGKVMPDGEVVGSDVYTMDHFGGILPNVGDQFILIRTTDDYETASVQRRYFVTEAATRSIYWLLIVKAAEACSQFTQVATNALAVSDYLEAAREGRPIQEVAAKRRKANRG